MSKAKPKAQPGQSAADIARLKDEYIEYFRDVPVQRYAAMAIGRDEDTIILWRTKDKGFSELVEKARAEWVRKKATKVRAEFALERLEKDVWAERRELTGKDGGAIELKPVEVMNVANGDQRQAELDRGAHPRTKS